MGREARTQSCSHSTRPSSKPWEPTLSSSRGHGPHIWRRRTVRHDPQSEHRLVAAWQRGKCKRFELHLGASTQLHAMRAVSIAYAQERGASDPWLCFLFSFEFAHVFCVQPSELPM